MITNEILERLNPCTYCGENRNFETLQKPAPDGMAVFVRCNKCFSEAQLHHWNHPLVKRVVVNAQYCVVCESREEKEPA